MVKKFLFLTLFLFSAIAIVDLDGYSIYDIDKGSKTIQVTKNELFALKIESNPTTGYVWSIENLESINETGLLNAISSAEYEEKPNPNKLMGIGGYTFFKFQAIAQGRQIMDFIYKRSWEKEINNRIRVIIEIIEIKESL